MCLRWPETKERALILTLKNEAILSQILPEPKKTIGLSKADKGLLGLHNPRSPLSKAMLLQVYVWCCMFSRRGILDKND